MRPLPCLRRDSLLLSLAALAALSASCGRREASETLQHDSQSAQTLVAQADALYAQRSSIEKARQAAAVLRRGRMSDYSNYEIIWKLAKCDYYVGDHETDDDAKLNAFREGIAAGEAAVKLAPNRPEGHFWLGANLGGRAKAQGPLYALSSVPDIRPEMETGIKLDEGYAAGSAYPALRAIYPGPPARTGGGRQRPGWGVEQGPSRT